jgi:alanine-glyoxylate transaminase/serine-glyoxylate transaminase/serine-pyruvate transaminase
VLSDAHAIAQIVRRVSPETLVCLFPPVDRSWLTIIQIVMDGVCSVASEEIRFDDWGLDVVLTASQKGLGTPPGLSIVVVSERAIQVYQKRKTPVTSYYASWDKCACSISS